MTQSKSGVSAWRLTAWIGAAICVGAGLVLASSSTLSAATANMSCAGVSLPTKERAFGVDLVLNGMGIRSVTVFNIQIYVAGLYLERRTKSPADVLPRERTKLMVMTFLRDGERKDMVETIRRSIAQQPESRRRLIQRSMPDFEQRLPPARKGGRLVFAYGQGRLELRQNGKVLGGWDDPALAEAMFTMWLGAKPVDSDLKEGLLGGECD